MGRFKDRVAEGLCGRCGKNLIVAPSTHCNDCAEKQKINQVLIRSKRKLKNLCTLCGLRKPYKDFVHCRKCKKKLAEWQQDNRESNRTAGKRWRDRLRAEVIQTYGGICKCCGEDEPIFLTIDHINNDGADHRRALVGRNQGGGSWNTYIWLKKNNFPSGFQVLCWNCNWAKSHGGCPHGS